jgi:hypothetical protein
MSVPSFFALANAWLFLLLVPLVLFYFLKLKRPRMEIPSLALWRQVIDDQRVNSPFQRFKRNLLLLLQALLLCLLALAAMQPFLASGPGRAGYVPVLIDCSASMGALDGPGGKSRLDAAKERVAELIENMLPDQQMSLIAFHSTARRLTDFTNNKRVLREALQKLEVADVPSQIEDALRMSQALSRTVPIETVLMFTDGNLSEEADFELPFQLSCQIVPAPGENAGITALNARRTSATKWEVFARIEGSKAAQGSATAELIKDGQSAAEESVVLEPGESQRVVFRLDAEKPSAIELRLKLDGFDSLASDNVAYLDLPPARPLAVFAHQDMYAVRHALSGLEQTDVYPDDEGVGSSARYDLVISDRREDAILEAPVSVFIGFVPDDLKSTVSIGTGSAVIVDWERSAPLLQHVYLGDVQTTDEPVSAEGVREGSYEELGYEILAHGRRGPLILQKRNGASIAYYFLFHTDRSTLPYRVGFPILMANAAQIARETASLSEIRGSRTGILPPLTLERDRTYRVAGPDGARTEARSTAEAVVSGVPAPRVGQYDYSDGGRTAARVGASLLDTGETSLASVREIRFRELSVEAAEGKIKSDRPLWPAFAMIGFCVLLTEWWFFQRRPGGYSSR